MNRRMNRWVKSLPRPKTRVGAIAVTLVAWVCIPLPGVFEGVLFSLWPRKLKEKA